MARIIRCECGFVRAQEVEREIDDPRCTILDVRTVSEFKGDRFWPSGGLQDGGRAGHIPSALSLPLEDLYHERGSFREPVELRERLSLPDSLDHNDVISYCTIGGRACTAWFVLTYLLHRPGVRVYEGSWAEWGLLPGVPVATRDERLGTA